MEILVLGLALFLGIHSLPLIPGLRNALASRFGEKPYKGMFSVVAVLGLVLIAIGYGRAPAGQQLFAPFPMAARLAPLAMLVSFVLLASANMRTHIRRAVRHPMLIGTAIWALVHLLTNGELRATLLFGAFLVWAALDLASAVARGAVKQFQPVLQHDLMAVAGGVGLALAVMALHRHVFGVPAVPWGL